MDGNPELRIVDDISRDSGLRMGRKNCRIRRTAHDKTAPKSKGSEGDLRECFLAKDIAVGFISCKRVALGKGWEPEMIETYIFG